MSMLIFACVIILLKIAGVYSFLLRPILKIPPVRITQLHWCRLDELPPTIVSQCDELFKLGIGKNKLELSALDTELHQVYARLDTVTNEISAVQAALASTESAIINLKQMTEGGVDSLNEELCRLQDKKRKLMDKECQLMDEESKLMDEEIQLEMLLRSKIETIKNMSEELPDYVHSFIEFSLDMETILKRPPYPDHLGAKAVTTLISDFASYVVNGRTPLVDKTAMIRYLLDRRRVIYRRPRRYGKSLTLSMLKYFFYGATRLFEGTAIFNESIDSWKYLWNPSDKSTHCFPPRPVLHFDFSGSGCTVDAFERFLKRQLKIIGLSNRIPEACFASSDGDVLGQLELLIEELCRSKWNLWGNVVILVDEYDSIFNRMDISPEEKAKISNIVQAMFSMIKRKDSKIAFVYVTGITSYGMSGVYSGANNFIDLSHDPQLHSLCGFTEDEMKQVLGPMSEKEFNDVKDYYYGYSFLLEEPTQKIPRVFNPVAINNYYNDRKLRPYWSMTNSARESLVKYFPSVNTLIPNLPVSVPVSIFYKPSNYNSWNTTDMSILSKLLFESGYLTIVGYNESTTEAILDFPNQEVRSVVLSEFK